MKLGLFFQTRCRINLAVNAFSCSTVWGSFGAPLTNPITVSVSLPMLAAKREVRVSVNAMLYHIYGG